jgi:two-component system response regulator
MSQQPAYIVDDSADQRFLLMLNFKRFVPELPIEFFDSAEALFKHLWQYGKTDLKPAVIVLDLNMPGMDGLEALKLLKQPVDPNDVWWKAIPVVLNSSDASEEKIMQCYSAGASNFLIKSPDFENLRQVLVTFVNPAVG